MSTHNVRPFSKREKKVFTTVFVIGAIIIAAPLWWRSRNAIPDVHIPEPQMPTPNGFEYFVNAGNAVTYDQRLFYVTQNYSSNYKSQNFMPLPTNSPPSPATPIKNGPPLDRNYSLQEKERILKPQLPALKILRQGLKYKYLHPPVRSLNYGMPYLIQWRSLLRVLILDSQVRATRGDYEGAANSALDAVEFISIAQRGAPHSLLRSYNADGRYQMWKLIPKLNVHTARTATQRLEDIIESRTTLAEGLIEEKWYFQSVLLELHQKNKWREALSPDVADPLREPGTWWQQKSVSFRSIWDEYTQFIDGAIAAAKKPYTQARQYPTSPESDYLSSWTPEIQFAVWADAHKQAQNSLLLVTLALRSYQLEHNTYPNSLNELVPRYLKKIPNDGFADNKPLQYKCVGSEYSLYSIGPDCVDNNGRAIDSKIPANNSNHERLRYRVEPDSKGDIVSGVNVG